MAAGSLVSRLQADQRQRWQNQEPQIVETYLDQHPELRAHPEAVAELIWNEWVLRRENGETPAMDDYLERFREFQSELGVLFQLPRTVNGAAAELLTAEIRGPQAQAPSALPDVPGFEFLEELGRVLQLGDHEFEGRRVTVV